jgi:hypothetical protein
LRVIIAAGKFHGVIAAVTPTGDRIAVDALALLGEPLDKGGGIGDLAARLGQRFALLGGHQTGEIFLVGHHQLVPAAQDLGPLFGGAGAPGGPGARRRRDRPPGFLGAHLRHGAEPLAARRVLDGKGGPADRVDPFAIDIGLLPEQLFVVELHRAPRSAQEDLR